MESMLPALPTLKLKERPVQEMRGLSDFDVVEDALGKSTLVYLKDCHDGALTIRSKITKIVLENCQNVRVEVEAPLISGHTDLLGCQGIVLNLVRTVPVITMDGCHECQVVLHREDPATEEFQLNTTTSDLISIVEGAHTHVVPDNPQRHITRFQGGIWLTELVILENGYQTTPREKELNEARAKRDEQKLNDAMKKSISISSASASASSSGFKEPRPSRPGSSSTSAQPGQALSLSIRSFSKKQSLKPTTTVEKTLAEMAGLSLSPNNRAVDEIPEELKEHHETLEEIHAKVLLLAEMVRSSKHIVAFTGAGISQSSGIPTYRGPNGFWTRRDQGLPPPKSVTLDEAKPVPAHMALAELVRRGLVKHVVSTNVDGLHRRSGIKEEDLSELHGNCFKEDCRNCRKEFLRTRDATPNGTRMDHLTGNVCDQCGGPLVDNIVNFGETLPESEFAKAQQHAEAGDLALVLGTSMKVSPACNIPDKIWKKPTGKMVIVNLQKTPYDRYAKLRIFGETDVVLRMLMDELALPIPSFQS